MSPFTEPHLGKVPPPGVQRFRGPNNRKLAKPENVTGVGQQASTKAKVNRHMQQMSSVNDKQSQQKQHSELGGQSTSATIPAKQGQWQKIREKQKQKKAAAKAAAATAATAADVLWMVENVTPIIQSDGLADVSGGRSAVHQAGETTHSIQLSLRQRLNEQDSMDLDVRRDHPADEKFRESSRSHHVLPQHRFNEQKSKIPAMNPNDVRQEKHYWPKFKHYNSRGILETPESLLLHNQLRRDGSRQYYASQPRNIQNKRGRDHHGKGGTLESLKVANEHGLDNDRFSIIPVSEGNSWEKQSKNYRKDVTVKSKNAATGPERKRYGGTSALTTIDKLPQQGDIESTKQGKSKMFTVFELLPAVLRMDIYNAILAIPQTVILKIKPTDTFEYRISRFTSAPPILGLCKESRKEAMKHYEVSFSNIAYFNYDIDSIWLQYDGPDGLVHWTNYFTPVELQKIHRIVLTLRDWIKADEVVFRNSIRKFVNLKKISFVVGKQDKKWLIDPATTRRTIRGELTEGSEKLKGSWKVPKVYLLRAE